MLVTFDVVQDECRPVTRREHSYRLVDRKSIGELLGGIDVVRHGRPGFRNFFVTRLHFRPRAAVAEVHLDSIDYEAVKPRSEQCLAPEAADPAKDQEE